MSAAEHDPDGSTAAALPLSLSIVAGLTDVTTFVLLHGVFSAHITGNLVVLAADVATGRAVGITTVLAIPCFIVTAGLVTLLVARSARPATFWITPLLIAQALLLVAAAAVGIATRASTNTGTGALVTGLFAIAAMAVQNTLLHVGVARSPTTAVMTGNVVAATVSGMRLLVGRADPASDDRAVWRRTWPLIVGFLAGCLVGGVACRLLADFASLVPMVAAVVVAIVFGAGPARARADRFHRGRPIRSG